MRIGLCGDIIDIWIVFVKVHKDSIKAGSYEVIQVDEWIGRYKRLALDIDIEISIRIPTFRVYSYWFCQASEDIRCKHSTVPTCIH